MLDTGNIRPGDIMTIEAALSIPVAAAQLIRFHFDEPVSGRLHEEDSYVLNMCLTPRPRNARARYCEHWRPHRFEPLGDVFVLPPRELMHAESDRGMTTAVFCWLRSEPIRSWFGADLKWSDRRLEATLDVSDANLRGLLLRLAEELRNPGFASQMLVELLAGQMAIELGRFCTSASDGPVTGGLAPWRLRLIDERLREGGDVPSLTELASLCNLSVRQLTRGFRTSRGCSIGDYVAQSRVEQAKRLLASDRSVKAIAYSLGFASPSGFCYAFRRAVGETPRQFRQRALYAR